MAPTSSSPPPGSPVTPDGVQELARAKRTISQLNDRIKEVEGLKKPKPVTARTLGRGIRKTVTLFDGVQQLVNEADRRAEREARMEDGNNSDESESDDEDMTPEQRAAAQREADRLFGSYQELKKIIPSLTDKLVNTEPEDLMVWFALLTHGANDARGDDIHGLRGATANWLKDVSPRLASDTRFGRGLQHDYLLKLLTPIDYDCDDAEIRAKIRAGDEDYSLSYNYYVRLFYRGYKGDPDDVEKNFLKSALLVNTFRHIFTSPSSAKALDEEGENEPPLPKKQRKSKNATRANVAAGLNMDKVTPRSLGYVAVLLHHSLTDASSWVEEYNGIDYRDMYNFIIDYFEVSKGPQAQRHVKELLAWWNKKVFPNKTAASNTSKVSSLDRLAKQRAAREERVAREARAARDARLAEEGQADTQTPATGSAQAVPTATAREGTTANPA